MVFRWVFVPNSAARAKSEYKYPENTTRYFSLHIVVAATDISEQTLYLFRDME